MFESPYWRLDVAGWSVERYGECVSFVSQDIDAALQISTYHRASGQITDSAIEDISRLGAPPEVQRRLVRCGAFTGYSATFDRNAFHWRAWWLKAGATHLYVTYNCAGRYAGKHDQLVDGMLGTLECLTPDADESIS